MLLLLLCNWPPVNEVCLNHEVVVFQPCTVTPPHLGSIAIVTTFIYSPSAPPDSTIFLYHYFPSSILPLPPSSAVHRCIPIPICTHSPPLPERSAAHLDVDRNRHLPASAACLCVPLRVPSSDAVSRYCAPPPFPPLDCAQLPVSPWWVIPDRFLPSPLIPCLSLPEFSSESLHLLILGFLSGGFSREG